MSDESSTKKRVEASCEHIRKLHEKDAKNFFGEWKSFHKNSQALSSQESRLTAELTRLSERSDNPWAKGFAEIAELQKGLESIQENMIRVVEEEYLLPFNKRLGEGTKSFMTLENRVVKANKEFDANIQKYHTIAQAQRKKEPSVMLKSMEDLTKAVAETDLRREEMLQDLQFVEQERYSDWFKTYSGFLQTRLDYHEKCAEKMKLVKEKWYNLAAQSPTAPPPSLWGNGPDLSIKTPLVHSNSFDSKDSLAVSSNQGSVSPSKSPDEQKEPKERKDKERGNSFISDGIKKFATLRGKSKSNPQKSDRNLKIGSPHLVSSTTSSPNSIFAGLQPVGKCRVIFDYAAQRDDELSLKVGDVIVVLKKQEDDWWLGILDNSSGVFPSTFVEEIPNDEATPGGSDGESVLGGEKKEKEDSVKSEATESKSEVRPPPPKTANENKKEGREAEQGELPKGWKAFETEEGEKYYHNAELDVTTWDFPKEESNGIHSSLDQPKTEGIEDSPEEQSEEVPKELKELLTKDLESKS